jgi:hypothetical protein
MKWGPVLLLVVGLVAIGFGAALLAAGFRAGWLVFFGVPAIAFGLQLIGNGLRSAFPAAEPSDAPIGPPRWRDGWHVFVIQLILAGLFGWFCYWLFYRASARCAPGQAAPWNTGAAGRRSVMRPRLTVEQVLAWADAHHARKGNWPTCRSGPVVGAPGETWVNANQVLERGLRRLPKESSLHRLLVEHRGVRCRWKSTPLMVRQVLSWARAHRRRTGRRPSSHFRGLPGEDSLARLLERRPACGGGVGRGQKEGAAPATGRNSLSHL